MGADVATAPPHPGQPLSVQGAPGSVASPVSDWSAEASRPTTREVTLQPDSASKLGQLIYAAKPVTWRGQGDLLQCSWAVVPKGTILLIDPWSGMGGLPLALLCMGATFYAMSAESDPHARAACAASMPHITSM